MTWGWRSGRTLWLTVAAWVATLGLLYAWWWRAFDGPWAPPDDPRYVQLFELLPIVGSIVALYGVQPRLDWIELQSPRPTRTLNTVAAGAVVVAFALLPLLTIWLWHHSDLYTLFVPEMYTYLRQGEFGTYSLFGAFACNTIIVLGLACLTTAFVGRALGPLSAIVWFALLLVAQGHLGWHALASITVHGDLPEFSLLGASLAAIALATGLYAYHRSSAGIQSVI